MSHPIAREIPVRAPMRPPEASTGLYTLSQPHASDPVGWLWVSQNGAVEDWVVTSDWRDPSSGNPQQLVTFAYVAPSSTVTSVTEFLAWIKDQYSTPCANITDRYRHSVTHSMASCPP